MFLDNMSTVCYCVWIISKPFMWIVCSSLQIFNQRQEGLLIRIRGSSNALRLQTLCCRSSPSEHLNDVWTL